ncbi:MAG: type II secretion system protein J [Microcella pacifica]
MSAPRPTDAGFTLVELLISAALTSVVIIVIGGVLVSSMQADETVRTVTTSTTDGQLVANVIDGGMRNSTAVAVSTAADGVLELRGRPRRRREWAGVRGVVLRRRDRHDLPPHILVRHHGTGARLRRR